MTHLVWLSLALVLSRLVTLATVVILARSLGDEDYGLFAIALAIPSGIEAIADLGIAWAVTREGPMRVDRLRAIVLGVLPLKLVLAASLVATSYGIALSLGASEHLLEATVYLAVGRGVDSVLYLMRAFLQAQERMRSDAFFSVFDALVRLSFISYGYLSGFGVGGMAKAMAVGSVVVFIATTLYVAHRYPGPLSSFRRIPLAFVRDAMPLAGVWLLDSLALRVGLVITGMVSGAATAGILAVAARLAEPLLAVPALMSSALMPLTSRHVEQQQATVPWLIESSLRFTVIIVAFVSTGIVVLGPLMISAFFGDEFASGAAVLRLFGLALVPLFVHVVVTTLLLAIRRHQELLAGQAVGLVFNVVLTVSALPLLGPAAFPSALLFGESVTLAVTLPALRRQTGMRFGPLLRALPILVWPALTIIADALMGSVLATMLAIAGLTATLRFFRLIDAREVEYLEEALPSLAGLWRTLVPHGARRFSADPTDGL